MKLEDDFAIRRNRMTLYFRGENLTPYPTFGNYAKKYGIADGSTLILIIDEVKD